MHRAAAIVRDSERETTSHVAWLSWLLGAALLVACVALTSVSVRCGSLEVRRPCTTAVPSGNTCSAFKGEGRYLAACDAALKLFSMDARNANERAMGKTKAIIGSYAGVLLYAGVVFLGAWRLAYWQGFLYVALAVVGTTLSHLLVRSDSDITIERARRARAGQTWDRRLLGGYFIVSIATFLIAGLDSGRFGWSGNVPLGVTIAGVVLMLLGQIIFAVAKRQNAFFSSTVRIQTERGHQVCDTGLYRFVRHPGYSGMLMSLLAFPLVMNSYWAFVPAFLGAVLLIARTVREDRFLMRELSGYHDYADRTRWRLVPRVF
jgi:protein-S-isoprenylcysteine O-methyltransferase Ste14